MRIVIICLVVERSLENACMAFCTWNKTLKGNTPVYLSCASSSDSSWFVVYVLLFSFFLKQSTNASPQSKPTPPLFSQAFRLQPFAAAASQVTECVLRLIFTIIVVHLNPAQRHDPKRFPFKGDSD